MGHQTGHTVILPVDSSTSARLIWMLAWSLADKIRLEAEHFLYTTYRITQHSPELHLPGDVHVNILSSFVLHGGSKEFPSENQNPEPH